MTDSFITKKDARLPFFPPDKSSFKEKQHFLTFVLPIFLFFS
jgi:hypothetical protein